MFCEKYLSENFLFAGTNVKPRDLSKTIHTKCGVQDSTVYVFANNPGIIPPVIQSLPHCGDPNCKGYCDDLACIPQTRPSEPENNSTTKENAIAASIVILFIALAVMHKLGSI